MEPKITKVARDELARAVRQRYLGATGDEKSRILGEFIANSGYHPKYAIEILNRTECGSKPAQRRRRLPLYDEAARQALIVMWEASDRICGKRLKPLLRTLLSALERHGHLKLEEAIRAKVLAMSAATIDRLLREPKAAKGNKRRRRVVPEIRRRVPIRTFADWNDPEPGSMEMDLVAHCGDVNRGSYVHSLVLTDIASGWTECTPLVVREKTLLTEALERVRVSLPFRLRALDVDNGGEFINETLIEYCLGHGIELTRSRPYRKNDQAWIEQKNGAVVRRMIGYRRFEGIAAAQALARLYASSRFFVNFFQPSFKLAEKSRTGAQVTKRYHVPETPCDRLLGSEATADAMRARLREVAEALDPLRLLEEIRTMQGYLVALADGDGKKPYVPEASDGPNLPNFLAGLSNAWRAGEVRPTHTRESKPPAQLLRMPVMQTAAMSEPDPRPVVGTTAESVPAPTSTKQMPAAKAPITSPKPSAHPLTVISPVVLPRRIGRPWAFRSIWSDISRRLEARPNLNGSELFDQLRLEYPGRYAPGQRNALLRLVKIWRTEAVARGIVVGKLKYRTSGLPRTYRTRVDSFEGHWPEMCLHLETDPDQTGRELFAEFQSRYPERYLPGQIRTLQRRLQIWRNQAARRLVFGVRDQTVAFTGLASPTPPPAPMNPEVGEGGAAAPPPPTPLSTPIL
jgi:hypothetical protein